MQVGSLIECVNGRPRPGYSFLTYPDKGVIYTVREFSEYYKRVLLEEIHNPIDVEDDYEYAFLPSRFIELQPPMDVSALFEDQLKVSNENRIRK